MPNEPLIPLPDEGVPVRRLIDLFCHRFFHYLTDRAAKDPVRTQVAHLDEREYHSRMFAGKVVICIAASSPSDITLAQPVAGVRIYHLGKLISTIKCSGGIATPWDVIIQVLCLGISKALMLLPNISFIQVFTTNLLVMTPALKADVGSNQGHRIAIVNALAPWLSLGDMRTVHFWAVPSRAKWPLLQCLINDVNNTSIAMGRHLIYTVNGIHSRCISAVNTAWSSEFYNNPGLCFLHLRDTGDRLLWLTYVNRGAWLKHFGSLSMTTWAV
jgi:hypothetical protein